jgi:hypothetical protein
MSTGKFCIDQFKFILADKQIGDLAANGVLGLSPGAGNPITALKERGEIEKAIVGLNYENPQDTD